MTRRGILAALFLVAGTVPAPADSDQDAARDAYKSGRAVSLERILQRARQDHPGEVLGVEIERHGDELHYELRILAPDGQIGEWRYDARSGAPLDAAREGHD